MFDAPHFSRFSSIYSIRLLFSGVKVLGIGLPFLVRKKYHDRTSIENTTKIIFTFHVKNKLFFYTKPIFVGAQKKISAGEDHDLTEFNSYKVISYKVISATQFLNILKITI